MESENTQTVYVFKHKTWCQKSVNYCLAFFTCLKLCAEISENTSNNQNDGTF